MGFFDIYKAIIFNEKGDNIAKKPFRKTVDKFTYKSNNTFVVDLLNGSDFKIWGLFWNTIYYQYQIGNPLPYSRKKRNEPIINSDLLNTIIENKVAKDLNDLSRSKWQELFTIKNIVIALAVIGVVYYFASGGTLV